MYIPGTKIKEKLYKHLLYEHFTKIKEKLHTLREYDFNC